MRVSDHDGGKCAMPFLGKHKRAAVFATFLASLALLLIVATSASALSIGVNWRSDDGPGELNEIQRSGATVYHLPIDFNKTRGGKWGSVDLLIEEAWKREITIFPTLIRHVEGEVNTNNEERGNRFLLSGDADWGAWGAWSQEVVERYGVNGNFWNGKANPTPITAWEIWNEPNLIVNNPRRTETQCKSASLGWNPVEQSCVQPAAYATFVAYTAGKIQAGSFAKTAHGTDALFGGLYMPAANWNTFLSDAKLAGGLPGDVTGLAIHPYALVPGKGARVTHMVEEMATSIESARFSLDWMKVGGKSLWITELGWPVGGSANFPTNGEPVTEAEQAELLTQGFDWIKANASALNIQTVEWFNVRDYGTGSHWAGSCGLRKSDGTYRPAWYAFQKENGVELTGTQWTAFQANTGQLWTYGSSSGHHNTELWMGPNTSPSVTSIPRGGAFVSFQAANGELWYYSSTSGTGLAMGLAMAPNSSPSVTYVPGEGYVIAVETWNGQLWTYSTVTGQYNTGLWMKPETSPSITPVPGGGHFVAFEAPGGELWYYSSTSKTGFNTGEGMAEKSSPSLGSIPQNGFLTAFQANNTNLFLHSTVSGPTNIGSGMMPGTSPSLAIH